MRARTQVRVWRKLLPGVLGLTLVGSAVGQGVNLSGMQVWNVGYWETVSIGDFIGPNYEIRKLKPISLTGCCNGYFSGYVVVTCSTAPITGLKANITDLEDHATGQKIPASCVRIRYPELARPGISWSPPYRFDRFSDEPPQEVPMTDLRSVGNWKPKNVGPVSMQPIWVTVYVPSNTPPGEYTGKLQIESNLNKVPDVPVKIKVAEWTLPDPKNFRVTNFGQSSPESLAQHYRVPRWSDKHFELIAKSLSLMAELNSRQAIIDLCIDFYGVGGVPETMVRWVKQADGTYTYDFTVLDRYLETVAKAIGKPTLLRVNCWMEWDLKSAGCATTNTGWSAPCRVTTFDPATGELGYLDQPRPDTPEFVAFWKPVLMEVRKRIEALEGELRTALLP
ncbi:MAG: glycoside hydrolase domain-containing protein, partial [Kiritimatiellia bacterium]